MEMLKLKDVGPSRRRPVFQWNKPSLVCDMFAEAQWRHDILRTYVFQCSFHASCWKYTLSHHRGPRCPFHWPNHERVHLKPQRLDMTWVYCLGCISLPSVHDQGTHRPWGLDEDCRTLLKVQSLRFFTPWKTTYVVPLRSITIQYILFCFLISHRLRTIMTFMKYLYCFLLKVYLNWFILCPFKCSKSKKDFF